jgi:hypothetical protein
MRFQLENLSLVRNTSTPMRRRLLMAAMLAALSIGSMQGCVDTAVVSRFREETERAAGLLEKELGSRPQISANVVNEHLNTVTVLIEGRTLQDLNMSVLRSRVDSALSASLSERPARLVISLSYEEK